LVEKPMVSKPENRSLEIRPVWYNFEDTQEGGG